MPQTISTKKTRLEKAVLEVFIGVEQVKVSRQVSYLSFKKKKIMFSFFLFIILEELQKFLIVNFR